MDFNLKSDAQGTCLTLIVNSNVCLGRLAGQLSIRNLDCQLSVHMEHYCQVA